MKVSLFKYLSDLLFHLYYLQAGTVFNAFIIWSTLQVHIQYN